MNFGNSVTGEVKIAIEESIFGAGLGGGGRTVLGDQFPAGVMQNLFTNIDKCVIIPA